MAADMLNQQGTAAQIKAMHALGLCLKGKSNEMPGTCDAVSSAFQSAFKSDKTSNPLSTNDDDLDKKSGAQSDDSSADEQEASGGSGMMVLVVIFATIAVVVTALVGAALLWKRRQMHHTARAAGVEFLTLDESAPYDPQPGSPQSRTVIAETSAGATVVAMPPEYSKVEDIPTATVVSVQE